MASILIAAMPEGQSAAERILGTGHEFILVAEMSEALTKLKQRAVDLILIDVHFDQSRMFDLLREVQKLPKCLSTPVICFCTQDTALTRTAHESIDIASK